MGNVLFIKGADFTANAVDVIPVKPVDINELMLTKYQKGASYAQYGYQIGTGTTITDRALFYYGLHNDILSGYSKIKIEVSSKYKFARQYWKEVLPETDFPIKSDATNFITDSSAWSTVALEEDIPNGAKAIGIVIGKISNNTPETPDDIELKITLT